MLGFYHLDTLTPESWTVEEQEEEDVVMPAMVGASEFNMRFLLQEDADPLGILDSLE